MECDHRAIGLFLDAQHQTGLGLYSIYRFACDECSESVVVVWRPDEDNLVRALIEGETA
jgi:hypothetical protein